MARILSYLFHPVFAPLISIYILFQLPIYFNYQFSTEIIRFAYIIVVVNLIVSPVMISFYLKKKGLIKSLEMKDVKDRTIPYLISSLFYIFTYFLFEKINFPLFYLAVLRAAAYVIIGLMFFSMLNWKVSAHLAGLGGICGMLFIISPLLNIETSLLLISFILISGIVAAARYSLKAHSFAELISGFCLGFGMQLLIFI